MLNLFKLFKTKFPLIIHSIKYSIKVDKKHFRLKKSKEIAPSGWLLLLVPAATFGLGTWQIERKKWKDALVTELKARSNTTPVILPSNKEEIKKLEFTPVIVRGEYLHDREVYIGPRTLLEKGDAATQSAIFSKDRNKSHGFLVVTPFKLEGRDEVILINRGWVPAKFKNPQFRKEGQINGIVDVIGLVRLHENRPPFMPSNTNTSNSWLYRDLVEMAAFTGSNEIFLDATEDFPVNNGPIAGQTRIALRNEHFSYILTWYSLSGITSYMWYKRFIK